MLKSGSILTPRGKNDGIRMSVMSRHTLNDSVTPDRRITLESFDVWGRQFAVPEMIIGAYYKGNISWSTLEINYMDHLRKPELRDPLRLAAGFALAIDITLLCIEDTPEYCHRRLLAEELYRIEPGLKLDLH